MATFVGPLNLGGTFSGSALDAFGQRLRSAFPGLTGLTSFVAPGGRGVNALGFTHPRSDLFAGQPPSSLDAALAQQPSAVFQGVGTITPESITSAIAGLGQGHTSSPNIAQPAPPPSVTFPGQPPIPPDLLPGDIPVGGTGGMGQSIAGGPIGGPSFSFGTTAFGQGAVAGNDPGPTPGQAAVNAGLANLTGIPGVGSVFGGHTQNSQVAGTIGSVVGLGVGVPAIGPLSAAAVAAMDASTTRSNIAANPAEFSQGFMNNAAQSLGGVPLGVDSVALGIPALPPGVTQNEFGAPPAAPPAPVAPVQTFTRDIQGLGPVTFSVDPQTNIPVTNQFGLFSDPTNMFGIAQPTPGFSGMFGNTSNFAGQPQGPAIGDVGPGEAPGPGPGGSSSGSTGSGSSGDPGTGGEGGAGGGPGGAAGSTGSGSSGDPGTGGEGQGGPGTGGGGGGGAGGGDSVICTLLKDSGLEDRATWAATARFGRTLSPETFAGYQRWAAPWMRYLRRHPRVFRLTYAVLGPVARAWVQEMAYRVGHRPHGSWLGRTTLACLLPVCRLLGRSRVVVA